MAVALHACLAGWAALHEPPGAALPDRRGSAREVEVSLVVVPTREQVERSPSRRATELTTRRAAPERPGGGSTEQLLVAERGGDFTLVVPEAVGVPGGEGAAEPPPASQASRGPRLSLDALGISGGTHRSQLMDLYREPEAQPDVGGLRRGLAARDAARGHGASGAAVSAAHGAALKRGPRSGTALFDVLVDREGRVQSVTIVQARPDFEAWGAVASELAARLEGRKLRVPPNSDGVRTRIEVAIGDDARDLQRRAEPEPNSRRGGFREDAVGATRLPARTTHTESTREHIYGDPGVLSPTLGVGAPRPSGARSVGRSRRVWVRVVGETRL